MLNKQELQSVLKSERHGTSARALIKLGILVAGLIAFSIVYYRYL